MNKRIKILTGKFGHWEILNFSHICSHGDACWKCKCDICGNIYSIRSDSLQSGRSTKCRKCGCRRKDK